MMKRGWVFVGAFLVLGVLVACAEGEDVVVNTAVPTPPPTIEPTVTETAVSSVNLLERQYQLTEPDAQTLIQLRMSPDQMPQSFANEFDLKLITSLYPGLNDPKQARWWNIFIETYVYLIDNDLQFYFPQEIPGASAYLFPQHGLGGYSNYLFGRGVIDFLNTYDHSLNVDREEVRKLTFDRYWYRGRVLLRSIPMQLDNDLQNELLLLIEHPDVSARFSGYAAIPVNITSQGYIQTIPNNFSEAYHVGCDQIDISHDLSQDGQTDILFYCDWHTTGFSSSMQKVFGWNEAGVYLIGFTEPMSWDGGNRLYAVEVADADSDGFDEIIWREPCDQEHVSQCEIVKTFSWNNSMTDPQESPNVPPVLFNCELLLDGIEKCLSQLRHAVLNQTDPTIPEKITQLLNYLPADDPDAQPYIEHLTYLLGYFYELSGDGETAVSTYLDLIQQYPTSPWSWLAWARLGPVE